MRVLRVIGKSAATTLIFFLLVELALRAVYAGRNALVTYVPLPYIVGDDYSPHSTVARQSPDPPP